MTCPPAFRTGSPQSARAKERSAVKIIAKATARSQTGRAVSTGVASEGDGRFRGAFIPSAPAVSCGREPHPRHGRTMALLRGEEGPKGPAALGHAARPTTAVLPAGPPGRGSHSHPGNGCPWSSCTEQGEPAPRSPLQPQRAEANACCNRLSWSEIAAVCTSGGSPSVSRRRTF